MTNVINIINDWINVNNNNRYGIMALTITFGSCLGSIAAMLISQNHAPFWQLALCTAFTMMANSAAIAQAPFKWIIWVFLGSVAVNSLLILIHLF